MKLDLRGLLPILAAGVGVWCPQAGAQALSFLRPVKGLRIEIWEHLRSAPRQAQPGSAQVVPPPVNPIKSLDPRLEQSLFESSEQDIRDLVLGLGDRLVHQSIWRQSEWETAEFELSSGLKVRGGLRFHPSANYSELMPSPHEHWSQEHGDILAGLGFEISSDLGVEFGQYFSPLSQSGTAERYDLVLDTRPQNLRNSLAVGDGQGSEPLRLYAVVRGGLQQLHLEGGDPWGTSLRVETGLANLSLGRLTLSALRYSKWWRSRSP